MIEMEIERLVPKFILRDRNGYAMIQAIGKAMEIFVQTAAEALDIWGNPDQMPEWRLDELADEYGILYSKDVDVRTKRRWIKNAYIDSRTYGTKRAIFNYLQSGGRQVNVWEWDEYSGEPYHMKALVDVEETQESAAWVNAVMDKVKNVRTVIDEIIFSGANVTPAHAVGLFVTGLEIVDGCSVSAEE